MYKSIVVGTDGSVTASGAVTHAGRLAALSDATVHVVSAYKLPNTGTAMAPEAMAYAPSAKELKGVAEEALERAASQLRQEGVKVELHACPGGAAEAIIGVAETTRADLVVVGSRGMSGARRLLGSVPNSVTHHAPCSVLIAHTT